MYTEQKYTEQNNNEQNCCTGEQNIKWYVVLVAVMCWACWSTMEMGFVDRPFVFEATLEHFHHPRHKYHHLLHNPPQTSSYYMLFICQTSGLV